MAGVGGRLLKLGLSATLAALVVEATLTAVTDLFIGSEGQYGGPLPVGTSCGFCVVSFATPSTFSLGVFAIDTLITALVFAVLIWRGGDVALVALGSVVFLALVVGMYAAGAPFAGIPLPVAERGGSFDQLALWIDLMVGAALFALPGVLRASRLTTGAVEQTR